MILGEQGSRGGLCHIYANDFQLELKSTLLLIYLSGILFGFNS